MELSSEQLRIIAGKSTKPAPPTAVKVQEQTTLADDDNAVNTADQGPVDEQEDDEIYDAITQDGTKPLPLPSLPAESSEPIDVYNKITSPYYSEFTRIGQLMHEELIEHRHFKAAQSFFADQYFNELGQLADIKKLVLSREHFAAKAEEKLKLKAAKRVARSRKKYDRKQYSLLRADERRAAAAERKDKRQALKLKMRLLIKAFFKKLKHKFTKNKGAKPPKEESIHDD